MMGGFEGMASADVQKFTMKAMRGMRVHFDEKLRGAVCHENKHINKELSHLNEVIGCDGYDDMLDKLNKRIKECDSIHPPQRYKKDRIVACSIEIKCPQQITDEGKSQEWFENCYKHLCDKYGKENVLGGFVHRDEVHEYYDSQLKENITSLVHCNFIVVPYCQWMDKHNELREGVNAKNFVNRTMLKDLNKSIDSLCKKNYGINYMTHGLPRHQSVEELKRASETEEQIISSQSQLAELNEKLTLLINELNNKQARTSELAKEFDKLANDFLELEEAMRIRTSDITQTSAFQEALRDKLIVEGLKQAKQILQGYKVNPLIINDIDKRIANQERVITHSHNRGISI